MTDESFIKQLENQGAFYLGLSNDCFGLAKKMRDLNPVAKTVEKLVEIEKPVLKVAKPAAKVISKPEKKRPPESSKVIADALKGFGRFVSKNELEEVVNIPNLSAMLSLANKHGKEDIICVRVGKSLNNYLWGFKSWVEESGDIKASYMYKEGALRYPDEKTAPGLFTGAALNN